MYHSINISHAPVCSPATIGHIAFNCWQNSLLNRGEIFCKYIILYKGTYKYGAIKRCQPLVWGNMTHDDASVETGVGGQAKYDVMMVFCGNALQQHHETLKTSSSWYSDCHTAHFFIY